MLSLTYINGRVASISTGHAYIHMDIDKMYTHLETLATHTVSLLLFPPSKLKKCWKNIRGKAQNPHLTVANYPNEVSGVIMSYFK